MTCADISARSGLASKASSRSRRTASLMRSSTLSRCPPPSRVSSEVSHRSARFQPAPQIHAAFTNRPLARHLRSRTSRNRHDQGQEHAAWPCPDGSLVSFLSPTHYNTLKITFKHVRSRQTNHHEKRASAREKPKDTKSARGCCCRGCGVVRLAAVGEDEEGNEVRGPKKVRGRY